MSTAEATVVRASARLVLVLGLLGTLACAATREGAPQAVAESQPETDAGSTSHEAIDDGPDDGHEQGADPWPIDAGPVVIPRTPTQPDSMDTRRDAGPADAEVVGEDAGTRETPLLALTPCPEEDANVCPETDPLCYWEGGPGGGGGGGPEGFYSFSTGWSVCTRFCQSDADCPSALGQARCIESGSDHICLFDCSFGRSCPGDLACSYGDRCANHFCDCTGDAGCNNWLCLQEDGQ